MDSGLAACSSADSETIDASRERKNDQGISQHANRVGMTYKSGINKWMGLKLERGGYDMTN